MRIIFVLIGLYPLAVASISLSSYGINLFVGTSFAQYVKHHETEIIYDCTLEYVHKDSHHQVTILMDQIQEFSNETIFGKRLNNLGRHMCGIKVDDYQEDDPSEMALVANYIDRNNEKKIFRGTFDIKSSTHFVTENEVIYVVLGSNITIECPNQGIKCSLLDPQGNVVYQGRETYCQKKISHVTVNHVGNWTCSTAYFEAPMFYETIIEIRTIPEPYVATWYKEDQGFGMIGCNYVTQSEIKPAEFCQFVDPHREIYSVSRFAGATERYTSVGTDIDKMICQIEFKLPLLPKEIGIWKCMVESQTGGFVNVLPSTRSLKSVLDELDYSKRILMYIELGSSLDIFCQVPYSSSNCYIKSPTNEYILGGDTDGFQLGECKTSVNPTNVTHLGIWTCHYSKPASAIDDIIEVEVREHNSVYSVNKDVEVGLSQSAELMCKATVPIQTCQYRGPSGLSHNVFPEKQAEGIDYIGRGLQYGDCGLRIDSVRPEHAGVWTCIVNNIKFPDKYLQDTARVYVDTSTVFPKTASATSIGVAVGVMAVAVAVLGAAIFTRYKKRSPGGRLSNDSNGSNPNVSIVNAQVQNVYSTNDHL